MNQKFDKNCRKLKVIVISRKWIFFFPTGREPTVQENLIKLLTSCCWQLCPPSFTPPCHCASTCIQFHACSILFSGSCGTSLTGTAREARLFPFSLFRRRLRGANPMWRPCCIIFWGRDSRRRTGRCRRIGSR
jgi:hypothetical protein